MNIIEQATQRLEELKRAGIDIPWGAVSQASRNASAVDVAAASASPAGGERLGRLSAVSKEAHARRSREISVDLDRLARLGYIIPGRERSRWAEEFRAIKRSALETVRSSAGKARHSNLIMVTSAVPGDGKTFCALNLALSIAAEVDTTVMLVDADVVQPAIMDRLGVLGDYKGLLDVLDGSVESLSDVLLRPNLPKLTVLPAGSARENASELLASVAMDRLLDELSSRYADRIVLFDAPPLLLTSEAKALAAKVGQLLMVVREGVTTVEDLTQAYAAVEAVPNVFSVLNGGAQSDAPKAYGTGYGYGYGA